MKRIISLLLFAILIVACISVPVFAKDAVTTTTGITSRYVGSTLEDRAYVTFRSNDHYNHYMRCEIGLKGSDRIVRGKSDVAVYFDGVSTSYSKMVPHSLQNKVYYKRGLSLF